MTAQLGILARAPELGVGKRRLAEHIGDAATLAVYQALLRQVAHALDGWPGTITLYLDGAPAALIGSGLEHVPCKPQAEGSLAQRIHRTLGDRLKHGPAMIIGTDTPLIKAEHLANMATLVEDNEVVIGPAVDGGYWALGLRSTRHLATCCAEDLPWSSPDLFAATINALANQGCYPAQGPRLRDLDTVDDLRQATAQGFAALESHSSTP